MKATLSELHKRPGEILRAVKSGHPVTLTEHGTDVAVISPLPAVKLSGKRAAEIMRRFCDPASLDALQELGETLAGNEPQNGRH